MSQCAAGQFCKHVAPLTRSNTRPCLKCQRPLHHSCAWSLNNATGANQDGSICPNCWSAEVGGTSETVDTICNLPAAAPQLLLGPQPLNQFHHDQQGALQRPYRHFRGSGPDRMLEQPKNLKPPPPPQTLEQAVEEADFGFEEVDEDRRALDVTEEVEDFPSDSSDEVEEPSIIHRNQVQLAKYPGRTANLKSPRRAVQRPKDHDRNRKIVRLQKSRMQKEKSKKIQEQPSDPVQTNASLEKEPEPAKDDKPASGGKRLSTEALRRLLQVPKEITKIPTKNFIIDGIDITKRHGQWQGEERIITPHKRASAWWLPYQEGKIVDSGTVTTIGVCNICGMGLKLGVRSGTSSLTRHLSTKHPTIHTEFMEAVKGGLKIADFFGESESSSGKRKRDSDAKDDDEGIKKERAPAATSARLAATAAAHAVAARCLDAHVVYAAAKNRPFSEFDDPAFCALRQLIAETAVASAKSGIKSEPKTCPVAENLFQVSSLDVQNRARSMAHRVRVEVSSMIEEHVVPYVGSLHLWNGRPQQGNDKHVFRSFSIHWIKDFKLVNAVIGVSTNCRVSGLDWRSKLAAWSMSVTPSLIVSDVLNEGDTHVECLDHKFQQVAEVAFCAIFSHPRRDSADKAAALEAARHLCRHFATAEMAAKLRAKQRELWPNTEPVDVIEDFGTQWWSTALMVERLIHLREAIVAFDRDPGFIPALDRTVPRMLTLTEWNSLLCFQAVLAPFVSSVRILERHSTVTSSLVVCLLYEVREQLQDLSKNERNEKLVGVVAPSVVATLMLEKINQIGDFPSDPFGEKTQTFASTSWRLRPLHAPQILSHALDPRFKKLKIFDKYAREVIWSRVHAEMVKLGPSSSSQEYQDRQSTDNKHAKRSSYGGLGAFSAVNGSDDESDSNEQMAESHWEASCTVELSGYKLERGIKFDPDGGVEQDPLLWWSSRTGRFPTLWKLCQVYFAMPAVASDLAFTAEGNRAIRNRCIGAHFAEDDLECIHYNKQFLT